MKRLFPLILIGWGALIGCRQQPPMAMTDDIALPVTPVKDQGDDSLCWAYAMLATIETNHIVRGDSVNLSPYYVRRLVGRKRQRGMGHTLTRLITRRGIVPFDTYPDTTHDQLPLPRWVFMLGARYTPEEFAHSVCTPDEYMGICSDRSAPCGREVVLQTPDNWEHQAFHNTTRDSLVAIVVRALRARHAVCWEGDTGCSGFSFKRGIADSDNASEPHDDHCMAIVGLAHNAEGQLFFKLKNSWGTDNPYGGMMYMSANYLRNKTVALFLSRDAYRGLPQGH